MKKLLSGLLVAFFVLFAHPTNAAVFIVPQGGTGVATVNGLLQGNGTSAFTGITTSAGIASVITDETGTGKLVFGTSPTLITPILGVATATSLNGVAISGSSTPSLAVTGTSSVSGSNTGDQTTSGTTNRITVSNGTTNPTIDISSSYVGQSTITTLGTIGSGVWQGTKIGLAYGGTNADLSGTGGTSQVLQQASSGAAITVGQLAASNLSNGTTGSGAIVLATSPTLTTAVLGSSTGTTQSPGDNSTKIATTAYVDAAVTGTDTKDAVKYASTGALPTVVYSNGSSGVGATLTGAVAGALSLDSSSPSVGDRILIKNQVSTFQNGIYTVTTAGSGIVAFIMTRTTDFDQAADIDIGDSVFVTSGSTLINTTWVQNGTNGPVMGTDPITFSQIGGPGSIISGNGITVTGLSIAIDTSVTVDKTTAQTLTNKTINGASNTLTVRAANDITGVLPIANGGTGQASKAAAFNALSPMTTLGDIAYEDVTPTAVRLAGNTTSAKQYLSQTGTGAVSAAPAWATIAAADIGSGATLSKADDTNVTLTLGGTPTTALLKSASLTLGWTGTLAVARGGTGSGTSQGAINNLSQLTTTGDLEYFDGTNTTRLPRGSNTQCLTANTTTIVWGSCSTGGSGTPAGSDTQVQFNDGGTAFGASSQFLFQKTTGTLTLAPTARTTGSPNIFVVTSPADTTLTASTESTSVNFNTSATRQFAAGALTTQRESLFQAPTYSFVSASTITNAATVAINGAPIAGTNATITNPFALWIQNSGALQLGTAGTASGNLQISGSGSGTVKISVAAAAGTWTFTLPTSGGSNGQFLQTNGSGTTTWANGTDVQTFTTTGSQTWTKPAGAKSVTVLMISGGGGGGSGRKGAAASIRSGGSGGGGGGMVNWTFPAGQLGSTETVIVGAGGSGGAAQATNSTNGTNGGDGTSSTFGVWIRAGFGGQGLGGSNSAVSGGNASNYIPTQSGNASNGGSSGTTGASCANGTNFTPTGGCSGGTVTSGNAATNGAGVGAGTGNCTINGNSITSGVNQTINCGTGGIAGGTIAGGNGVSTTVGNFYAGSGAGGGAASTTGAGGAGGVGGLYGGGGGGGGASVDSVGNSGAGGAGGNGIVIIITDL